MNYSHGSIRIKRSEAISGGYAVREAEHMQSWLIGGDLSLSVDEKS